MRNLKSVCSAALIAVFATGCTTVPFEKGRPVQFQQGFFQAGFAQNGDFVKEDEAVAEISKVPEAAAKLKSGKTLGLVGLGLSTGGLIVALTARGSNGSYNDGQFWTGFGLIIAAIPVNLIAVSHFSTAADLYNNELVDARPRVKTSLYLSPVKSGGVVGLAAEF